MRSSPFLAASLVAVTLSACGSGTPPGGGSAASPDAGSTGTPDAGTGSDAGTAPDAGGVGTSDGGPVGGPGGGSDAGADAGSASAECEGIVPSSLGSSFSFDVPNDFIGGICNSDTTDESGNIASSNDSTFNRNGPRFWHTFDPAGHHLARFTAFDLFPQQPGFEGLFDVDNGFGATAIAVGYWTPDGKRTDGAVVGGDQAPANGYRASPNGLFVVMQICHVPPGPPGRYELSRFDDRAQKLASANLAGGCDAILGAVADANGNWVLAVHGRPAEGFAEDAIFAQWFDSAGNSLTGWFRVGAIAGTTHTSLVHALIGGGAALQLDGAWMWFLPSGKAEAQPAPAFLLAHPDADFTLVRGARAYALLPRSGDTTQIELYSAGGNRCGSLKFSGGGLTTGADGSVISASGSGGCTKTVWPGLLR